MDGGEFGDHLVADSRRGNRLGLAQGPVIDVRSQCQSVAMSQTGGHGHPNKFVRLIRLNRTISFFNFQIFEVHVRARELMQ